ncbi:MAG TPA: penicillin acylase family protein, partial [Opitutus sp.]|nr:penicillin acylase family protein [Opitutus sp.]
TALGAKPFEYILARAEPAPWKIEDSLLIVYAMILDLQDSSNDYELSMATLRDRLGMEALAFFAPLQTPNDAALDHSTAPLPPIPGPKLINLRSKPAAELSRTRAPSTFSSASAEVQPGSNSFALSGRHTASGAAMLANDPHLDLRIPNIWYRAVLEWPVEPSGATPRNRVVGVSLPGLPFIVLGSNGHVAWGLTHAYADTSDLVAVDLNPVSKNLYKDPERDGLVEIEIRRDTLQIKGGGTELIETEWTHWGPIVARDFRDRPLAHRWVAHDPAATNLNYLRLESARNVTEAIEIAQNSGIPAHNFMVADRAGDIGWTIAGKFPKRVVFDGRLPVSWNFGDRSWQGFVPAAEIPFASTARPPTATSAAQAAFADVVSTGRLWTANNRLVGGANLALLGDGGYAPAARGRQIRDRLATLEAATPRDFLAMQLDDRGLFLEPWHTLLLSVLTPERIAEKDSRGELRRLIENWEGRATVDSVSYRLVRNFRAATADLALTPIFADCVEVMPDFDWHEFDFEPALWVMLEQQPSHLLAPEYTSWDELLLAAADDVVAQTSARVALDRATWGERNTARIVHPLADSLPLGLGRWLNLPKDQLPGDIHMPLIQNPSFGASMRLVVSPGREHEGLFHMPGGQSGHPLSDFYRAGHAAWVKGEPMPLLPGETMHMLHLTPE